MATWKKVLTHTSAVSDTDGLKINAVDGSAGTQEKIVLSDGTNTDEIVLEVSTGLSIARTNDTITFTNTVADTTLTEENVEDIVGGMLGGTETGISVTYVDGSGSGDGTIDFVVADQTLTADATSGTTAVLSMSTPSGTPDSVTFSTTGGNLTITSASDSTIAIGLTDAAIQDALTDVTLVSSTDGTNVDLTLTGPGAETDVVQLTAGDNVTITQASGNNVTFAVSDSDIQAALTDLSLSVSQDGTGADITFTGPGGETDVLNLATSGGITITASGGDTITLATDGVGTVSITDSDTDELAHLVFTTATSGSGSLKVDSSTLSYNASSDTLFVNNLTVSGTTTTVQTANLVVEDKNVILGSPDTAYADDSSAVAGASGGGITLVSDSSASEGDYAGIAWDSSAQLTKWSVRDAQSVGESAATKFPIAVMEFGSTAATAPTADAAGIGSFHINTTDEKIYIRTA